MSKLEKFIENKIGYRVGIISYYTAFSDKREFKYMTKSKTEIVVFPSLDGIKRMILNHIFSDTEKAKFLNNKSTYNFLKESMTVPHIDIYHNVNDFSYELTKLNIHIEDYYKSIDGDEFFQFNRKLHMDPEQLKL